MLDKVHIALWRKPLWNLELRILSKRSTSAPIFLYIICFRWKLDANNVWSVSFSFKYYLSTSWLYKEGIRVHTVKTTCERERATKQITSQKNWYRLQFYPTYFIGSLNCLFETRNSIQYPFGRRQLGIFCFPYILRTMNLT